MAQFDLIQAIADPRLRAQIASEVGKLKARKKFGLVFEQHLPRDGPVAESSGQAWYSCRVPRRPGGAVGSPYRRDGPDPAPRAPAMPRTLDSAACNSFVTSLT